VPRRYEFEGRRADGERLWVDATVSPVVEAGRIVGTQSILRDVTEQKRAQEEVRRLAAELEARVRTRTSELADALGELESFSYSISHDLRSPLRAMSGFSSLVIEEHGERLPEEGRRMLGRISDAATTMGELIDGLLALAQIGRHPLQRRRTELALIAHDVWSEIAAAHPERAVRFETGCDTIADCDPILLRSVLQNLLGNAFKYTRDRADAQVFFGCEPGGGGPTFCVRDNGVGFDPAYADRLFRPFERLHGPGEFEGTGIGLATVRRVIQRHGGRVWAEATPGGGATFHFTLGPL
jgi:signal transduction histidine kinase